MIQATHSGLHKASTLASIPKQNKQNIIPPSFLEKNIVIICVISANSTGISTGIVLTTNAHIARKPVDEPLKNAKSTRFEWMALASISNELSFPSHESHLLKNVHAEQHVVEVLERRATRLAEERAQLAQAQRQADE
jgi:hypothetical protein